MTDRNLVRSKFRVRFVSSNVPSSHQHINADIPTIRIQKEVSHIFCYILVFRATCMKDVSFEKDEIVNRLLREVLVLRG